MQRLKQPAFGDILTKAIASRGWSLRAFCREVKLNTGNLMEIINGDRNPPLAHLEPWAVALGLRGKGRLAFMEAGWLANSPPEVKDLVASLRRKVKILEGKVVTKERRRSTNAEVDYHTR